MATVSRSPNAGDFRLIDRGALDALLSMPERNRFLRGMSTWIGFRQQEVSYDRDPRHAGETKYPLVKLIRLAVDGVASFSHVPLQLAAYMGFLFAGLAFLGVPAGIAARLLGIYVPGIASVIMVVCFLGGLQLITLGVIGEYLGRMYDEVKRRPLYIVHARVRGGLPVRGEPTVDRRTGDDHPTEDARHARV
jgi:dolichol-phosphate mannosyltransferase